PGAPPAQISPTALHDALPIWSTGASGVNRGGTAPPAPAGSVLGQQSPVVAPVLPRRSLPMVYPVSGDPLVPSPNLPALENAIQEFWRTDDTFRASIAQREGAEEFVFYDGPPFPNGLPHYGHLLIGFVQYVIPRY